MKESIDLLEALKIRVEGLRKNIQAAAQLGLVSVLDIDSARLDENEVLIDYLRSKALLVYQVVEKNTDKVVGTYLDKETATANATNGLAVLAVEVSTK